MNENADVKEEFKSEFHKAVEEIRCTYSKDEKTSRLIVGTIICNLLKRIQIDADERLFMDFYRKYIHTLKVLSFDDFTASQLQNIIDETPMSDDDKKIAHKLFIERKTYQDIARECYIGEPRTIGNNRDRISKLFNSTTSKLYKS